MKRRLIFLLLTAFFMTSCAKVEVIEEETEDFQEIEEIFHKTEIIIGTTGITGVFSPFLVNSGSSGDSDIMRVINVPLVTLDRRGEVVRNAGIGEMRVFDGVEYFYEGIADTSINITEANTTIITFRLREDVFFSDGEQLTADDVIFTLYALLHEDYKGDYAGIGLLPIEGLVNYKTNANNETFEKYAEIAAACLATLLASVTEAELDEEWAEIEFTEEQYELFYDCYERAWLSHVRAIADYCVRNYSDYAHVVGSGNIHTDEWMQAALAMMIWRVADFTEIMPATGEREAVYGPLTSISGREWDLTNRFPTLYDFYREFYVLYDGNLESYINAEKIGEPHLDDPLNEAIMLFIKESAAADEANRAVANISGIRRVGDFEVAVTLAGHIPAAVYSFAVPVAPLHYYGDLSLYDYRNNKFGFERENLSVIRENYYRPLGAGPYKFAGFDIAQGTAVVLEANEFYFKGSPEVSQIYFVETSSEDLIFGAASGALDIAAVTAAQSLLDEINAYYETGLWFQEADYGTFGYIGFNAERVSIEDEPLSEESVSFRKGIATVLAAYREISVRDFFGEAARVVEYPVPGVSWAAPRQGDSGFRRAFSTDSEGQSIYTSDMNEARQLEAARRAALDFFEAAGCELNAGRTAILEFPEGLSERYEVYIVGFGAGRHPSYLLLTMAADMLRTMGITLEIKDVSSQGEMYSAAINGEADMWCAAWYGTAMTNMTNMTSRAFSSNGADNFFELSDELLDQRIALAETSLNLEFYRNALEAVLETAVIVPVYQRQMYFVFSGALDESTVETGLTTHYGWAEVLWKMRVTE